MLAPFVPVPKAPMNKDYNAITSKDEVRGAGEIFVMETETQSPAMQKASNQHFGPGVLAANTGHHSRSGLRINNVCHDRNYFCRLNRKASQTGLSE